MKANKITLIAQAIGMYVMYIPLYIIFIIGFLPAGNTVGIKGLFTTSLVLMGAVSPICITNIVMSAVSIFRGEVELSKTVMKVKLALIPWYITNFAMCVVIVAIMLNPFLMLGIPVVIGIVAGTTYFYMLATSLPDVAYYLNKVFVKKEEKLTAGRVFAVVCLFIFCLDVIGSIILYRQNKKAALPAAPEASTPTEQ